MIVLHGDDNDPVYVSYDKKEMQLYNWSQEMLIYNMYKDEYRGSHLDLPVWLYGGINIVRNICDEELYEAKREAGRRATWQARGI